MKGHLIILLTVVFSSCRGQIPTPPDDTNGTEPITIIGDAVVTKPQPQIDGLTIAEAWQVLIDTIGGCTVGGQYCRNGVCGGEGCCFSGNRAWKEFLSRDKTQLTQFLIARLGQQDTTKIHVCPFFRALEGEAAVYALQQIHTINWYDMDPRFSKYVDGTLEAGEDFRSLQEALQNELKTDEGFEIIKTGWN